MLVGIGTDIVEIERIAQASTRTVGFAQKVMTPNEYAAYEASGSRVERLAGTFAAKEAVSKALGTGFRTFEMHDIEVQRNAQGQPSVVLYNNAKGCLEAIGGTRILVSISHSKSYATAMVTIEKAFI